MDRPWTQSEHHDEFKGTMSPVSDFTLNRQKLYLYQFYGKHAPRVSLEDIF